MDLTNKLSMLSNGFASEEDLAGITPVIPIQDEEENTDEVLDFNLGELSIDKYLSEKPSKSKKSKKDSERKTEKSKSFFDDLFTEDSDEDDIGNYRTGNIELDKATARSRRILEQADLIRADEFDSFLDDDAAFAAEEDTEMRNHLVAMGRKYARDSAASKESSEISKTFAESEQKLKTLYEEVDADKKLIQNDIARMRVPGRGGKILADMIAAKNSYHSTQLAIVKELNAMKKASFELRAKEAARKEAENNASNDISANTLQSIFSSTRNGLVGEIGGYSRVSGAIDDSDILENEDDDEIIQKKYFHDTPPEEDGDKWLKYEDRGVEYVLIVNNENKPQTIIAEDKDGIMIPDYPIPENIHDLEFDIDRIGMTATDNIHRNYRVRVEE